MKLRTEDSKGNIIRELEYNENEGDRLREDKDGLFHIIRSEDNKHIDLK